MEKVIEHVQLRQEMESQIKKESRSKMSFFLSINADIGVKTDHISQHCEHPWEPVKKAGFLPW